MNGRLYIGGREVDLSEGVPFPLNFSIANVRNPEKRQRNFSKTIALPGTANNREVFASARMLSIADLDGVTGFQFDPTVRTVAEYWRGNYRVFAGLCELQDVDVIGDDYTFNINLLSSFLDLFQQLGNIKVNELGWSEYDHQLNRFIQQDSWDTSVVKNGSPVSNFTAGNPDGFGYLYGLVNWGYENQFDPIFSATQIILGVYFKEVWDKCMALTGFSYTSTFINSDLFKRLILYWAGGDRIGISLAEKNDRLVDVTVATSATNSYAHTNASYLSVSNEWNLKYPANNALLFNGSTVTVNQDNLNQWQSNKSITVARKGNYTLNIAGKLGGVWDFSTAPTSSLNNVGVYFTVFKNNWPQYQNIIFLGKGTASYDTFNASVPYSLEVGDIISFRIQVVSTVTARWSGTPADAPTLDITVDNDSTPLEFDLVAVDSPLTDPNDIVNVSRFVSDMKAADFLKGVITMFNLYISEPDEDNEVRIEPLEAFYTGNFGVNRWRPKLDKSKPMKIIPTSEIEGKTYAFKWAADNDYYNRIFREAYGIGYGDYNYDVQSTYQQGIREYKLPFAQTIPVAYDHDPNFVIPMVLDVEQGTGFAKPFKGSSRVFIYNGLQNGNWRHRNEFNYSPSNAATYDDLTTYPQLNHLRNLSNASFDLNWGVPQFVYWAAQSYTNNNLWKQHERFIRELTGRDSKLWQAYFKLNANDVTNINFAKPIEVDGVLYRLNEIKEYDPEKDETTWVELVKMVEITAPAAVSFVGNEYVNIGGDLLDGGTPENGNDTAPDLISGGLEMTVESSAPLVRMSR
jgi:hypothetical protein